VLIFLFEFMVSVAGLSEQVEQLVDASAALADELFERLAGDGFQSQCGIRLQQSHLEVMDFALDFVGYGAWSGHSGKLAQSSDLASLPYG
jgi:hypothetical protein